jgi:uncharacterized protein YcaQ
MTYTARYALESSVAAIKHTSEPRSRARRRGAPLGSPPSPTPAATRLTLDHLRAYALERSLFEPTTLAAAIERLGYVQADPIRAPARAQDLTLRQRVVDYRAGDLEAQYAQLEVEEDFFVNYGFVARSFQALMHPRKPRRPWTALATRRAGLLAAFIAEHQPVHPRQVDAHFSHGKVVNYWGGSSNATTHLLDAMHYRGVLRVARRERGIRLYALRSVTPPVTSLAEKRARLDRLIDMIVATHTPLPVLSLHALVSRMRYATPQWQSELKAALTRAKQRFAHAQVDGVSWYWPGGEDPQRAGEGDERVRLLAPFDPVVWDRRRFELFWGWPYRFEAYTPVAKRRFGYYALPMLWRGRILGWANLSVSAQGRASRGGLDVSAGYVKGRPPREPLFRRELEAELERVRAFLDAPED